MQYFSENEIPNLAGISSAEQIGRELEAYLKRLQEKLNYLLTHIGDGNINFGDITELAGKIAEIGGGINASDS